MANNPNVVASGSTNWVYRYQSGLRVPAIIFQDKQWYDVWIRMSDGRILAVKDSMLIHGSDIVELTESEVGLSIMWYKAWPWKRAISSTVIMKHLYTKVEGRQEVMPQK